MTEEEYEKFADESRMYLRSKIEWTKKEFLLGEYERYDWDQDRGELVFSDGGVPKVIAKIQFVGSYSEKSGTWLWSWDNSSVLDHIKQDMLEVRKYGEKHNISKLSDSYWKADEVDAWEMTAIAANILQAKGAYRSPDSDKPGFTFMVFTDIKWANKAVDTTPTAEP